MDLPCLGIDIAKVKFNVCLLQLTAKLKHKVFANTATGYEQLQQWLEKHDVQLVHACLEATGTYGEALSLYPASSWSHRKCYEPVGHQSLRRQSTFTHQNRSGIQTEGKKLLERAAIATSAARVC